MTDGQKLYEKLNPKYVNVFEGKHPWAKPSQICNPRHIVDWKFLTEKCKLEYEKLAIGHHLITKM